MKKKIVYINSKTNEEYLDELWFNARNGGKRNTQLEWWNKENWKIAVKGWIETFLNSSKEGKK